MLGIDNDQYRRHCVAINTCSWGDFFIGACLALGAENTILIVWHEQAAVTKDATLLSASSCSGCAAGTAHSRTDCKSA